MATYKLVTNDSAEYGLIALPFESLLEKKGIQKRVLCIPFSADIDTLAKVKEICCDELKMSKITVFENAIESRTESDYTVLEQITTAVFENENGEDTTVLMAKVSRSTTIPEQIMELEEGVKNLTAKNAALEEAKVTLETSVRELTNAKNILNSQVENLQKANEEYSQSMSAVYNLQNAFENASGSSALLAYQMSLIDVAKVVEDNDVETYKTFKILQSKYNLAKYTEMNTVTSKAHKGVEAEYSISEEKQQRLMAMVMMATMNPEYQPSWNASGEECSYDWTLDELQALAADIEVVIRPLVSKQQSAESLIRAAKTIEEIDVVDVSYEATIASFAD